MIRVLIADDHPLVRTGLRQILTRHEDMSVLGEAEDYSGILAQLRDTEYDVMLLDVSLPGKNGIEILKSLREIHPSLKVLIISSHPEDQYGLRALRAGARIPLRPGAADAQADRRRTQARGHRYRTRPQPEDRQRLPRTRVGKAGIDEQLRDDGVCDPQWVGGRLRKRP